MTGIKTIQLRGEVNSHRVWLNGKELTPDRSLKIRNHSPTGFCWRYCGSGPSQLALAVLLEITDKETALANYQQFKFDVIANLANDFDETIDVTKYVHMCRVCGCTEFRACPDDGSGNPCHWIEDNLCSACGGK
jgi:hypothetical protein